MQAEWAASARSATRSSLRDLVRAHGNGRLRPDPGAEQAHPLMDNKRKERYTPPQNMIRKRKTRATPTGKELPVQKRYLCAKFHCFAPCAKTPVRDTI